MSEEIKKQLLLKHKSMPFDLIKARRSELNRKQFTSEMWFEKLLIENKLFGYRRNECLLFRFFGDFVFRNKGVVVEIDGVSHEGKEEYDKSRDQLLELFGYLVFRVPYNNKAIADSVIVQVKEALASRPILKKGKFSRVLKREVLRKEKYKTKKHKPTIQNENSKKAKKRNAVKEKLKDYYALKSKFAQVLEARKLNKKKLVMELRKRSLRPKT